MKERIKKLWIIGCLLCIAFILFYPPTEAYRFNAEKVIYQPAGRKFLFETSKKPGSYWILRPNINSMIIEILLVVCIGGAVYLGLGIISKKED